MRAEDAQMRAMAELDEAADDGTAKELRAFHSKSEASAVESLAGARGRAESGAYLDMANASIQGMQLLARLCFGLLRRWAIACDSLIFDCHVLPQLASWSTALPWQSCCPATTSTGRTTRMLHSSAWKTCGKTCGICASSRSHSGTSCERQAWFRYVPIPCRHIHRGSAAHHPRLCVAQTGGRVGRL